MVLELTLILCFLITFGLMMVIVGTALVNGQRSNRAEMRRLKAELVKIGGRLGEPADGHVR